MMLDRRNRRGVRGVISRYGTSYGVGNTSEISKAKGGLLPLQVIDGHGPSQPLQVGGSSGGDRDEIFELRKTVRHLQLDLDFRERKDAAVGVDRLEHENLQLKNELGNVKEELE